MKHSCECCDYTTTCKRDFEKHLATLKHINKEKTDFEQDKNNIDKFKMDIQIKDKEIIHLTANISQLNKQINQLETTIKILMEHKK